MGTAAPAGSAAERFLTFPGSSPAAGTVLMGAGDGHACGDIGLVEGVNCRFIAGQGLDIGRPLTLSARHARSLVRRSVHARPRR